VCLVVGAILAHAADPNALWKIVHDRCGPGALAGNPAPCISVSADDAVLKDIVGATQFLLIPTARITGIESPVLLADGAPNYFADAWLARRYIDARVGHAMPRDTISLAINPPTARSQEQLHIHIDCVRPDVRDALRQQTIGDDWTMLPAPLADQRYAALRLPGDVLDANPFKILANTVAGAREAMGTYTLVLVGTNDPKTGPGFILLAGHVGAEGAGHGEDLQDHGCALSSRSPAATD
jgi:CDP-diacylglycerol pyrophosphatase